MTEPRHAAAALKGGEHAVRRTRSTAAGPAGARSDPGRWPRQSAQAIDRPARQARGVFRRQVPHHRLCAVELPQFRCPPDRRPDPIQGAQPAPPSADGLVVLAPGNGRVSRPVAGAAAARRGDLVSRHRRRGLPEFRHLSSRGPEILRRPGRRPHLQDGLLVHAGRPRRQGSRLHGRLRRGAARSKLRISA